MSHGSEKMRTLICFMGSIIIFAAIATPMSRGKYYTFDDLGDFHIPLRSFYSDSLAKGESFYWFPRMYCGFDLHGEGQVGMYHPLHFVLYRLLPFEIAFALEFLSSYCFLSLGTFLLFRRLGFRVDAAAFASLVFTFSGTPLFRYMHINAVAIISCIPWLIFAIDVILREPPGRRTLRAGLGVTILTTSQLLHGYPQWVLISLLIESLYCVFVMISCGRWVPLFWVVWFEILGVLLGSVQLIPTWLAIGLSDRQRPSLEFLGSGSFGPVNSLTLLLPTLFRSRTLDLSHRSLFSWVASSDDFGPQEQGFFNGTIVVALILLLAIKGAMPRWRSLARAAFVLSVSGFLLSLGRHTPIIHLLSSLPIVNRFRSPVRYLLLFHLGTTILATISLSQIETMGNFKAPSWRSLRLMAMIPLAGFALCSSVFVARVVKPNSWFLGTISSNLNLVVSSAVVTLIFSLVALAARGTRSALNLLLLAATAQQAYFAISYLNDHPPVPIDALRQVSPAPPLSPGYRVFGGQRPVFQIPSTGSADKFRATALMLGGTSLIDGYAGLMPRLNLDYENEASLRVAGAGSRWIERKTSSNDGVETSGSWVPVPSPLPRLRLLSRIIVSSNPKVDIEKIDVSTTAILEAALDLAPSAIGHVRPLFDSPGSIGLVTECGARQLIVLGERFHPGWTVTIDGVEGRPLRVNGDFMGSVVDSGVRKVIFRYNPPGLRFGLLLTSIGVMLTLATFIWGRF